MLQAPVDDLGDVKHRDLSPIEIGRRFALGVKRREVTLMANKDRNILAKSPQGQTLKYDKTEVAKILMESTAALRQLWTALQSGRRKRPRTSDSPSDPPE